MSNGTNQPFYFTSYGRIIGVAHDLQELSREMKRIAREDRPALEFHLENGHIVQWLEYSNEVELARELAGVKDVEVALRRIEKYLERSATLHRMSRGRMR